MTALATVTLPDNLYWSDEFAWDPNAQQSEYTLTGALIVEESTRQAGRPITLAGAWVDRATVQALRALAATPGDIQTLTLPDARSFQVLFRRGDQAIEAAPIGGPFAAPQAGDRYRLTLRLIEV